MKTYKEWREENPDTYQPEEIYNAAIKEAKTHYESEAVAIMEYYDMILRKTNAKSLDEVPPPPCTEKEREVISQLLAGEFK